MTKKLSLKVEDLRIEQFEVESRIAAARGTVHGHESQMSVCEPCESMQPYTAPCLFCPEMPITYSCDACG